MAVFIPITWPRAFTQGSTGVAGIDSGVSLDNALDRAAVLGAERAIECAHDAVRERSLQAEGIAESKHLLPDKQLRGVAESHGGGMRSGSTLL